jgi:chromate reductase, NAD(P)H dehydrogenase (quinone)
MTERTVGVIVGSVSTNSINRRLAHALAELAPRAGLEFVDIEIAQLPFYGTQYDEDYPLEGAAYKAALNGVDGLLLVTPEYNRSIPAVLKNAIDWATRPSGESIFPHKPVGVIGASDGDLSTAVAQTHLKSILTSQGAALVGEPEAYIHFTDDYLDDEGAVADEADAAFLLEFLEALRDQIARFVP